MKYSSSCEDVPQGRTTLSEYFNYLFVSVNMSFLGKVFGIGKKTEMAPTTGEAFLKLRKSEAMLIRKQEFLGKKIEQVVILWCHGYSILESVFSTLN